jgi:aminoglycoside phosphotransferase (APT) family kinase protein
VSLNFSRVQEGPERLAVVRLVLRLARRRGVVDWERSRSGGHRMDLQLFLAHADDHAPVLVHGLSSSVLAEAPPAQERSEDRGEPLS